MTWSNFANLKLSQRSTLTNASGVLAPSHLKKGLTWTSDDDDDDDDDDDNNELFLWYGWPKGV